MDTAPEHERPSRIDRAAFAAGLVIAAFIAAASVANVVSGNLMIGTLGLTLIAAVAVLGWDDWRQRQAKRALTAQNARLLTEVHQRRIRVRFKTGSSGEDQR